MKPIRTMLVAALAALGLAGSVEALADSKHGWRGHRGQAHGGHRWHGHRHWSPRWNWGLSIGVPLYFGSAYAWGAPYGYYGGPPVVYRETIREPEWGYLPPEPLPVPETTEVPRGEGAPTQGPMYMNWCESSRAWFPKVTSCPEGWKLVTPDQ